VNISATMYFHITNEEKACPSQWMLATRGLGISRIQKT